MVPLLVTAAALVAVRFPVASIVPVLVSVPESVAFIVPVDCTAPSLVRLVAERVKFAGVLPVVKSFALLEFVAAPVELTVIAPTDVIVPVLAKVVVAAPFVVSASV